MPYRQNYVKGNGPFEMEKRAGSTLSTGRGNHKLLFISHLEAKLQGVDASDDEELKCEILAIAGHFIT
jgi:hypothetical protein